MNKSLESTHENAIESIKQAGRQIIRNLIDTTHGYDTFIMLLSTMVWQSPKELAESWI
jgi:hypothetical protein